MWDTSLGGPKLDAGGHGGPRNQDEADLAKLGVRQQTKRRFGFVTMLGFATNMMCTWESAHPVFVTAFINGGPVTMIYGYIFAFFGALATCASIAEMASMYPISGGQYHWVALLAPPRHSRFLSWLTGWVSTIGWQGNAVVGTYLGGTIIQGLLALNDSTYEPRRWHATLIMYAVLLLTFFVNTVVVKLLPSLEGVILFLHVVAFFAILIPLVHLAPISSASSVFTEFTNLSGYGSSGLSWLIGQSSCVILFIGYDGPCHMAEEVQNPSLNVPRAMIFAVLINGATGFATYIIILFCFGDVGDTLTSSTGWPFIQIFYNATQSKAATTVMTSILVAMYIFATFGILASSSRQAWAFARYNGLPGSSLWKRIDNHYAIPLWAIGLSIAINALLGLVNIGSLVAFNAFISLVVAGYSSSYLVSIVVLITKRLRHEPIAFGPWTLGAWGLPINIFAAVHTTITFIFSFFPPSVPVTATSMNWSCVMYGGVVIIGIIFYLIKGHKDYMVPKLVESEA